MFFLNPSILFGLFAAAIPILIHLLNLRKLKKVEFSTLKFLKELQKNQIKKIKLRQWLLLFLRVAIILSLVLSLAQPVIKSNIIPGAASFSKTSAVFIFDNSFSNSLLNEKGSFLNQSKASALQLLSSFKYKDEAAVILTTGAEHGILQNDFSGISKRIKEISPSYISGDLNSALISAGKILAESNNPNKEIFIFTDLQKSTLPKQDMLSNLENLLDVRTNIYLINYKPGNFFNISLDDIRIQNQIFEKNKTITIDVTVHNHSQKEAENRTCSIIMNGEGAGQKSFSLKPNEEKTISIEALIKSAGFIGIEAKLEDDDITFDNYRYAVVNVPETYKVNVFANNPNQYLETAFAAFENNTSSQKPLTNFNEEDGTSNIIIASNNGNYSKINSYVQNGGKVFIIPSSDLTLDGYRNICSQLGIPAPIADVKNVKILFGKIENQHSIFRNIFADVNKQSFESPEVYEYFQFPNNGRDIIQLQNSQPFLIEYSRGKGKILVLSSAIDMNKNNFPLKAIFPALINKLIGYLSPISNESNENLAGDELKIKSDKITSKAKIVNPDGKEDYLQLVTSSNFVNYPKTDQIGIYQVFSDERIVDKIPVNFNKVESTSEYLEVKDFESYLKAVKFKGNFVNIRSNEDVLKAVVQQKNGTEIWKFFLFLALALTVAEMFVARVSKKEVVSV